jgi:hypothetical protein
VSTRAEQSEAAERAAERAWWLRALLVFQSPQPVFAALRDESREDVSARSEPLTAIVFLAAVAAVLWTPTTGRLMDDPAIDAIVVPVLAIFTGGIYAVFGYFAGGGAVYLGTRAAGSLGSYRRARHLFGFALAPLALSLLLLWPVRLALYRGDSFRSGGGDAVTGDRVFDALQTVFALWSLGLVVVGVRAVHGWGWVRALAAVALAASAVAALVAAVVLLR